jgi:D-alanyl-D-alanine carboxypeptidase (penicillin-binding protein 5/6)
MRTFLAILLTCLTVNILAAEPSISAESAVVAELSTGRILWQKNGHQRMSPASTTKIMTGLLLVENTEPSDMIRVPNGGADIEGSSIYLKLGERLNAQDLLYGLMVRSANDGAATIALHVGETIGGFARMMNERAEELGCTSTFFANPHGLDEGGHETSAADLALITAEAMKHERFRDAVSQTSVVIERSINQENRLLLSKNRFLKEYEGATGVKTGYTSIAGRCYVGSIEKDGLRFLTVVLNSEDWVSDTTILADWALANLEEQTIANAGDLTPEIKVEGAGSHQFVYEQPLQGLTLSGDEIPRTPEFRLTHSSLPIEKGAVVGLAIIDLADGGQISAPLIAAEQIKTPTVSSAFESFAKAGPAGVVIICALIGGSFLMRRRARSFNKVYRK